MTPELIERFAAIVGPKGAVTDPNAIAPHLTEWRGTWTGMTPLVLQPASVAEVSAIMSLSQETGTAIVPQSGNTGLVGGQIPDASGNQIIVSLRRMNRLRTIDRVGKTVIVDAGMTLQAVRDAADDAGLLFPLSLASQGSALIGGNIATNAGGTGALAYGVARDLVLGLEVVLPDGRILDDLSVLKKDNTGYALRHLFIGSEGTLGIITAASLKLFARPRGFATMVAAVDTPEAALTLLERAQDAAAAQLTTFELMADTVVTMAEQHMPGLHLPVENRAQWSVLMEISSSASASQAEELMMDIASKALEDDLIVDAVLAQSDTQRATMWALREGLSEAQKFEGVSIKHDISVPVHAIPNFIAEAEQAVMAIEPGVRFCTFGHMGDGNLHYNISQPKGGDANTFRTMAPMITRTVHDLVRHHGGSISAEHGIGQMKRDELAATKSPVALDIMRKLKAALDPDGRMNPGKLL